MPLDGRPSRNCLQRLRQYYPRLSPAEQVVAEFVLQQPGEVLTTSVHEIAERCGTSPSTIVRLAKNIGFDGLKSMKIALAQEIGTLIPRIAEGSTGTPDDRSELLEITVLGLRETAAELSDEAVEETVRALGAARRVVVFGTGSSYIVGLDLVEKLKRLGINAQIDANDYIQAITAAGLDADSVAIGISYSGETRSTLEHLHMAREQGARAIAITNFAGSTIVQLAEVVLTTAVSRHLFPDGGMGGRIAQLFVVDLIFTRLFASDVSRFEAAYRKYNQILLNKAAHPRDRAFDHGPLDAGDDGDASDTPDQVAIPATEGTR